MRDGLPGCALGRRPRIAVSYLLQFARKSPACGRAPITINRDGPAGDGGTPHSGRAGLRDAGSHGSGRTTSCHLTSEPCALYWASPTPEVDVPTTRPGKLRRLIRSGARPHEILRNHLWTPQVPPSTRTCQLATGFLPPHTWSANTSSRPRTQRPARQVTRGLPVFGLSVDDPPEDGASGPGRQQAGQERLMVFVTDAHPTLSAAARHVRLS